MLHAAAGCSSNGFEELAEHSQELAHAPHHSFLGTLAPAPPQARTPAADSHALDQDVISDAYRPGSVVQVASSVQLHDHGNKLGHKLRQQIQEFS